MSFHIRAAEMRDIPAIVSLQMRDAEVRSRLNPRLWALAANVPTKLETALQTISEPITGPIRHHWIVAERDSSLIGVMHGIHIPTPPIYEERGGRHAGVIIDDSHVPTDAHVATALLSAIELALRESGAGVLVAASPNDWAERTDFFRTAGYVPTTSYMFKGALEPMKEDVSSVRKATEADIDGIVKLSALHRAGLEVANPDFWKIHREADKRFGNWMRMSLGLQDRSMFVAGESGDVDGFVIAQPASPLHLTAAHDSSKLGLVDDFYAAAFNAPQKQGQTGEPHALLTAAEEFFRQRGLNAALVISPVRMVAKVEVLQEAGYRATNLWLAKPDLIRAQDK